ATFREEGPAEAGPSADEFTAASVDLPFAEDHGGPSSVGQADGPSDPHAGSASGVRHDPLDGDGRGPFEGERAGSSSLKGDGLTARGRRRKQSAPVTGDASGGWPSPEEWREQRRRQRESAEEPDSQTGTSVSGTSAGAVSGEASHGSVFDQRDETADQRGGKPRQSRDGTADSSRLIADRTPDLDRDAESGLADEGAGSSQGRDGVRSDLGRDSAASGL